MIHDLITAAVAITFFSLGRWAGKKLYQMMHRDKPSRAGLSAGPLASNQESGVRLPGSAP